MTSDAMQDAVRKADVLVEALPYIRSFQGKLVIIKLGGSAMEDPDRMHTVLEDMVFMAAVGMHPLVVHGGGPAISMEMERRGKRPQWVHGHRVTDQETLNIVKEVLVDRINASLVRQLEELGAKGETVFGAPLTADRKTARWTDETGQVHEDHLGRVGVMVDADEPFFRKALEAGVIPVVSPIATGPDGGLMNVNADSVAGFLAGKLAAEKVVFLSDTHGIMLRPDDDSSFAETLDEPAVQQLIRDGVITGGMRPKVEACIAALDHGVRKAHIVDGRMPHSLLLEIFTRKGAGTQILKQSEAGPDR